MRNNPFILVCFKLFFASCFYLIPAAAISQCTFTSTDGYKVTVAIKPTDIVVSNCYGSGFQYQIKYSYNIGFSSPPPVNKGLYTLFGVFDCGNLSVNLPLGGGSGTVVSENFSSYNTSSPSCNAATPTNIGCSYINIHIYAPGIPDQVFKCPFANAILPVTFLSFSASSDNNFTKLIWRTASETNNSFFSIEKSTDSQNWAIIGKVTGAGNSTQPTNYSFQDNLPNYSTAYYRIKQNDVDGNFSYSPIVSVATILNNNLGIFPNPNNSNTLNINGIQATAGWQLKLMNTASQVLYATTLRSNQLELPQIPIGTYFIKLVNTGTGASNVFMYIKM